MQMILSTGSYSAVDIGPCVDSETPHTSLGGWVCVSERTKSLEILSLEIFIGSGASGLGRADNVRKWENVVLFCG